MRENKIDATWAIIAALLVLFTTMIAPRLSAALAILLLVAYTVVKLVHNQDSNKNDA